MDFRSTYAASALGPEATLQQERVQMPSARGLEASPELVQSHAPHSIRREKQKTIKNHIETALNAAEDEKNDFLKMMIRIDNIFAKRERPRAVEPQSSTTNQHQHTYNHTCGRGPAGNYHLHAALELDSPLRKLYAARTQDKPCEACREVRLKRHAADEERNRRAAEELRQRRKRLALSIDENSRQLSPDESYRPRYQLIQGLEKEFELKRLRPHASSFTGSTLDYRSERQGEPGWYVPYSLQRQESFNGSSSQLDYSHEDDDHFTGELYFDALTEQPPALKQQPEILPQPARREASWRGPLLQVWHYVSRPALLPGHQRITYTCGCGKHMYADVQELYPGGAKQLEAKLRRSAAAASSTGQAGSNASPNMSTSAGDIGLATLPTSSRSSDSEGTLVHRTTSIASATSPPGNTAPQEEMFLLLCVSNNRRLELEQIKIMPAANDQIMFQDIRRAYLKLRQDRARQFHPKTPKVIQKFISTATRISTWTQSRIAQIFEHLGLEWLVWWIGDNVFVIPHTANFVRFELVPIRTDLCPQILESPCLPPEEQVKMKNYHYMPCPSDIKNPALRIPYLHDLFEPGIHLDDHWTETSPKKLCTKLHYTDSRTPAIGWGVHIVERTNWPAFAVLSAFGVVLSFIAAVVFSAVCNDPSSGFTIGSFSITCFALLVSVVGAAASTHS